jgi:hypothetical protein
VAKKPTPKRGERGRRTRGFGGFGGFGGDGGAIYSVGGSTTMPNCTISGNSTGTGMVGAALLAVMEVMGAASFAKEPMQAQTWMRTRAIKDGDHWILNGSKKLPHAQAATR